MPGLPAKKTPKPKHQSSPQETGSGGTLLSINSLDFAAFQGRRVHPKYILKDITFDILKDHITCLVGETGSGKSMIVKTILGIFPVFPGPVTGEIHFDGKDMLSPLGLPVNADRPSRRRFQSSRQRHWSSLQDIWGTKIAFIPQDPKNSLDATRTIGEHLRRILAMEVQRYGGDGAPGALNRQARKLLDDVEIEDIDRVMDSYPFQLSGGMSQRIAISLAMAQSPDLLLADEPTSDLDSFTQYEIILLWKKLKEEGKLPTMMLITHDISLVVNIAEHIVFIRDGNILERTSRKNYFDQYHRTIEQKGEPDSYPQQLLHSRINLEADQVEKAPLKQVDFTVTPVLSITSLTKTFRHEKHITRAVNNVDFTLHPKEVLGIIGKSGCGKTTTARCITGLETPDSGRMLVSGEETPFDSPNMRKWARYIFQDSRAIDPRMTIGEIYSEAFRAQGFAPSEIPDALENLLQKLELPGDTSRRYQKNLSGGQKKLVLLGRAFIGTPKFCILDEPFKGVDVPRWDALMNFLQEMTGDLSTIIISHYLGLIRRLSHTVMVMFQGTMVEKMPCSRFNELDARHPFTLSLLNSRFQCGVDSYDEFRHKAVNAPARVRNVVPMVDNLHEVCPYRESCLKYDKSRCNEPLEFKELAPRHIVACNNID